MFCQNEVLKIRYIRILNIFLKHLLFNRNMIFQYRHSLPFVIDVQSIPKFLHICSSFINCIKVISLHRYWSNSFKCITEILCIIMNCSDAYWNRKFVHKIFGTCRLAARNYFRCFNNSFCIVTKVTYYFKMKEMY